MEKVKKLFDLEKGPNAYGSLARKLDVTESSIRMMVTGKIQSVGRRLQRDIDALYKKVVK